MFKLPYCFLYQFSCKRKVYITFYENAILRSIKAIVVSDETTKFIDSSDIRPILNVELLEVIAFKCSFDAEILWDNSGLKRRRLTLWLLILIEQAKQ